MWLIIGYGNPLRGDDGAGQQLARKLKGLLPDALARILIVHQLTPELAKELVQPAVERVLFIDAKRNQRQDYCVVALPPQSGPHGSFGHQMQPEQLLSLAKHLYDCAIPSWLLTLPGVNFDFGERLSRTTHTALQTASLAIQSFINTKELPPTTQENTE